jgi:hypothetical protein
MVFLGRPSFDRRQGIGVMYVFLMILGAVTTAAGLTLVTSVATGAFDAETITPGTIAAVGGLLLVGLGLAVRTLQRIERALEPRPSLRPSRLGEAPGIGSASVAGQASGPTPIPFPVRPKIDSAAQAAGASAGKAAAAPVEDAVAERLRERFPTLMRLEQTPAVEDANLSLLPPPDAAAHENGGAIVNGAAVARTNGSAAARLASRANSARASAASPRAKGTVFDAFWPKGPRTPQDAEESVAPAPAQPAPAELAAASEEAAAEPQATFDEPAAAPPASVSVLKSGVVEGRAYTLYSDGSIEAQFPQGMMRFGSITELRNHIESSS